MCRGRYEKVPEVTSPRLLDHSIEIGAKPVSIDPHVRRGQGGDFRPGDERAATDMQWSKLGDGLTIPG